MATLGGAITGARLEQAVATSRAHSPQAARAAKTSAAAAATAAATAAAVPSNPPHVLEPHILGVGDRVVIHGCHGRRMRKWNGQIGTLTHWLDIRSKWEVKLDPEPDTLGYGTTRARRQAVKKKNLKLVKVGTPHVPTRWVNVIGGGEHILNGLWEITEARDPWSEFTVYKPNRGAIGKEKLYRYTAGVGGDLWHLDGMDGKTCYFNACPFPYQSVATVPTDGWAVWTRDGVRGQPDRLPVPTFTVHHGERPPPAALMSTTARGTALGKLPDRPTRITGRGMLVQVTAIKTALSITTPAIQMLSVVVEANRLLGLQNTGTIPDQIDAACRKLGIAP